MPALNNVWSSASVRSFATGHADEIYAGHILHSIRHTLLTVFNKSQLQLIHLTKRGVMCLELYQGILQKVSERCDLGGAIGHARWSSNRRGQHGRRNAKN